MILHRKLLPLIKRSMILALFGFLYTLPVGATADVMQHISQKTDRKLQHTLDQQFSQNLVHMEYTMLSEIEQAMGPYPGITNDVLIDFFYRIMKRHELEEPRS